MRDEDHIATTLQRNHAQDLTTNLKRDIEAFFAQKYSGSSCRFHLVAPQGEEMGRVDFTVSRGSDFTRRYVSCAGYVDGHLSLGQAIRLM